MIQESLLRIINNSVSVYLKLECALTHYNTDVSVFFLVLQVIVLYKTHFHSMVSNPYSYSIFFDFIDSYLPSGFLKIKA